ncbi:hypothetical protein Tco_0568311 [Tanacetum coccineum]
MIFSTNPEQVVGSDEFRTDYEAKDDGILGENGEDGEKEKVSATLMEKVDVREVMKYHDIDMVKIIYCRANSKKLVGNLKLQDKR